MKGEKMKDFVLYLNGINGLALGGAAILASLEKRELRPSKMYVCGVGALFANDFAALDGNFEERITYRFSHLSKSFRLYIETGDSLFSKFTSIYKLASSVASKKLKGFVKEKTMLTRLENTSKPKMDLVYSAVNILTASETLITPREWKVGLRAAMSVLPIFVPCDYRGQKLVSTTSVTGVPGFSKLDEEEKFKVFVNTMPLVGKKKPTRTWEIMMRADYLRTVELTKRFSEKFDIILDFSKAAPELSDFSLSTWKRLKEISNGMVNNILEPALKA